VETSANHFWRHVVSTLSHAHRPRRSFESRYQRAAKTLQALERHWDGGTGLKRSRFDRPNHRDDDGHIGADSVWGKIPTFKGEDSSNVNVYATHVSH